MTLQQLLGIDLPIVQAPMAGVRGNALTVAVSSAGGLGSLPCAMLSPDAMRQELAAIRAKTDQPYNVNFFRYNVGDHTRTAETLKPAKNRVTTAYRASLCWR